MSRLPILPTIVVGLAVAAMIGLGFWQLDRRREKEALIARYERNAGLPPMAFPRAGTGEDALFRRSSAMCLRVVGWRREGGRSASGRTGFRQIAECATGAEGPGLLVDVGVARDPAARIEWGGGKVTGTITHAPDATPLLQRFFEKAPPRRLMLVADTPAPGLEASARPDPRAIPNNHLAYAVQWFFFAAIAALIYVLALRRRR